MELRNWHKRIPPTTQACYRDVFLISGRSVGVYQRERRGTLKPICHVLVIDLCSHVSRLSAQGGRTNCWLFGWPEVHVYSHGWDSDVVALLCGLQTSLILVTLSHPQPQARTCGYHDSSYTIPTFMTAKCVGEIVKHGVSNNDVITFLIRRQQNPPFESRR